MMRKKSTVKRNHQSGFTLTEMLCTVLLAGMISVGLVRGVTLASKQYKRSVRYSSSYQLFTTLQTLISNELKYTNKITLNGNTVDEFYSVTYALENNLTSLYTLDSDGNITDGYGQLAIGDGTSFNRLLSSKSYSDSLGAKCTITYADDVFTVTLQVGVNEDSTPYVDQTFSVRSIETVSVEYE
jgi:prepilin-type N-terminal cleavage/methylation domain-containing protein